MIIPGLCTVAHRDFLMGIHQPFDDYKCALYGADAFLSPQTPEYTTVGEVVAPGYTAGGKSLSGYVCTLDQGIGVMGWRDTLVWEHSSISAYGALIYNASKGGRAVAVIDFEKKITSSSGEFFLYMPPVTAETAIIRIG